MLDRENKTFRIGNLYNNNNNFILFFLQELDSLPRKIAGKLVVAGQDKYMNNISTKNYYKALQVAT